MPPDGSTPISLPWQWCWECGAALHDWSTVYEMTTFVGRVVLCRHCGRRLRNTKPVTNRDGLLGHYDRERWKRAGKRDL